jgi:hypothetical protein
MRWRLGRSAFIALAAIFLFLPSTSAQKYKPPFPADLAKKVRENELLAIWDVTWDKGRSTGMRRLDLDQVSVTLTDGALKVTRPDGTWSIEQERLGDVRYESKGTVNAREGVSDQPSRTIVFQLKDAKPIKYPTVEGIPGQFPRVGAVKLFETDRINVWDQTWKAGLRITPHLHYAQTATVFLEGGKLRTIDQGKPPNPAFQRVMGEVVGGEPIPVTSPLTAPHEEEEVEGSPRAIWIEFK